MKPIGIRNPAVRVTDETGLTTYSRNLLTNEVTALDPLDGVTFVLPMRNLNVDGRGIHGPRIARLTCRLTPTGTLEIAASDGKLLTVSQAANAVELHAVRNWTGSHRQVAEVDGGIIPTDCHRCGAPGHVFEHRVYWCGTCHAELSGAVE